MARDLFVSKGLSAATINALAKATRSLCDISDDQHFDVIKFLEIDIIRLIPDFYLFIENDNEMMGSKAFVTKDSKGIVVAESVYNDAVGGLFYARKILAHEFGHVLLHHNKDFETKHFTLNGYQKQIRDMEHFHSAEWQADTFAIFLLVPPSQISAATTEYDFGRQHSMSPKQSSFILTRLKNLRKRTNTPDTRCVSEFLKLRVNKEKCASENNYQLNFFA